MGSGPHLTRPGSLCRTTPSYRLQLPAPVGCPPLPAAAARAAVAPRRSKTPSAIGPAAWQPPVVERVPAHQLMQNTLVQGVYYTDADQHRRPQQRSTRALVGHRGSPASDRPKLPRRPQPHAEASAPPELVATDHRVPARTCTRPAPTTGRVEINAAQVYAALAATLLGFRADMAASGRRPESGPGRRRVIKPSTAWRHWHRRTGQRPEGQPCPPGLGSMWSEG